MATATSTATKGFTFTFDDMTLEPIDEGYLTGSQSDFSSSERRDLGSFAPAQDDSFVRGAVPGGGGGRGSSVPPPPPPSVGGRSTMAQGHRSQADNRGSVTSSQATPKMRTVGKGPVGGATYTADGRNGGGGGGGGS
eukprot:CAMPEP_0113568278 /NCGR_PEP_ID=MMETSP0015_2-20120614/23761_1 /TAXON_ID=2838 /ORGANISM="Odontella" /LENGTH=136 /DNA_ID=CAMNT_0000470803 /DNA_START=437 /DNA_END=844 /DNA_ORIENTATION=+ /assembly_acc=CAM_ASM_000160